MKYLIAGLGNPGVDYENTRHNIGYKILDALAGASNIVFSDKRYGWVAEYKYKSRIFILLKPTTFMNLSGRAVNYWLQKENIEIENLLVLADDLALPFGTLRLRAKGSDAGHNGLKNINEVLGRQDYARLRFGIGDNFRQGQQVDYVLSEWDKEEKKELPFLIDKCVDIIHSFGTIGITMTMNQFNQRKQNGQ
ncbi:MAG: aminoacyl-tRNA hydrolase [Bacteroidetes bacterium GWF2_42_66]|nr:MAG: aminoacyl-tRNA hydrolase [Bacteroidetes bacterium GWA2_42_15]OFX97284.1 MAG: aminoacyl-tRNA hydrolase [Bacteroidetes bacterium GWE2_42_39]OFY39921.1 MAG: aminoacyl-tRNA hydrolase [Bacteroidetes bacterium GWF2_42_66]HBL78103.1 aminoacyl-tRNA hydrolase [Prolixibacteraceae bacterium]HCR90372.1 aminoacyl-tRNA hydrolase [Prolixibacteraceae bacterium]